MISKYRYICHRICFALAKYPCIYMYVWIYTYYGISKYVFMELRYIKLSTSLNDGNTIYQPTSMPSHSLRQSMAILDVSI